MEKFMIFGASGFVGKSLAEYLSKNKNYEVIKVYHKHTYSSDKNCIQADITNSKKVDQIIQEKRPTKIINLAGISSIKTADQSPLKAVDINVNGTINILESIKNNNYNCKLLVVGSSEEYAQSQLELKETSKLAPRNIYGMTKLWQETVAEWYHKKYGISIICVRSFNHTGIYQSDNAIVPNFCKQAALIQKGEKNNKIYVGNLNLERDLLDVCDVIRAYEMLLNSSISFGIYNICSGKKVKLIDMLHTITSFTSKDIKIVSEQQRIRKNDIPVIVGDNSKIKKAIDWEPKIDLITTLEEMYNYYLKKG